MLRGLSLVSLLIGVALLAYLWATNTQRVIETSQPMHDQAEQISGRGDDGVPAGKTITTDAVQVGGHLKALVVTDIVPGGALDKFYGLQKGDKITQTGDYSVETNDDLGMAQAMLLDAYQRMREIQIIRGSKKLTLPLPPGTPAQEVAAPPADSAAPASATASPSTPTAPPASPTAAPPPPPPVAPPPPPEHALSPIEQAQELQRKLSGQ